MTGAANLDWLYLLGGWLIGGCAAALLLWALFRDRGRNKRRCPKCWYDMTGTPGLLCPECGRESRNEKRLHRTKRRWRYAVLATFLALIGYGLGSVPSYQRGGWVAIIPSTALIYFAPATSPTTSGGWAQARTTGPISSRFFTRTFAVPAPAPTDTTAEILTNDTWRRLTSDKLAHWQSQIFLSRYLRKQKINLASMVTLPQRWAVNEPIPAIIDGDIEGLPVEALGADTAWGASMLHFRAAPAPATSIKVELAVGSYYRAGLDIPIALQGSREDLLEHLNSDAANAAVRAALNPHASMNGFEPVVVLYDRSKEDEWTNIKFGVAYSFEVTLDGAILFRGSGMSPWLDSEWKNWEEFAVPEAAREAVKSGRALITIRGNWSPATSAYAAYPFDKPSAVCWTGEFTMPLEMRWHPEINKGN